MTLQLHGTLQRNNYSHKIDLTIEPGEVVGVVGRNGAGKSTLVHTIAGIIGVSQGELTVNKATWDNPQQHLWVEPGDRSCAVVFQDLRLFPHMNVLKNIAFGVRAHGTSREESQRRAHEVMHSVGLHESFAERNVTQLSGGERQRVALARALIMRPDVLLLDEPFNGVDQESVHELRELLSSTLADFAGYALLVSHNSADIGALSTRTLEIA